MTKKSARNQYYAAMCVNLMTVSFGAISGWPSSSLLILQSEESPLESGPMDDEQASWVGSISSLAGLFGNLLYGWMADRFGRKISMLLVAPLFAISWILIIVATNVTYLLVSRFIAGLACGGTFSIVPLYITEIAEDNIRGTLGSSMVLSGTFGVLVAYILGCYVDYQVFPYIFLSLPVAFVILFAFLPETPQHLLKSKKIKEAEKSLRYFRNLRKMSQEPSEDFKHEMQTLKHHYLEDVKKPNEEDSPITWEDFTTRPAIKSFVIGIMLILINQFCGCFAMITYTGTIFVKAGSTLSPNVSAIIVGLLQLIGSYFSVVLVERAGRKVLISLSAFGTSIGLICMGIYLLLDTLPDYDVSAFKWIPLASFSFTIFFASWGVLTLPFLVLSEITPPKIRSIIVVTCMTILWTLTFLMVKYLSIIIDSLGMHGAMFFFAGCSFAGGVFVVLCVPETKGKSIDEIIALLK